MELEEGEVRVFKQKDIKHIIITIKGIDCNRKVRYVYGTGNNETGSFFTEEKILLDATTKMSPLEIELL